MTDLAGKCALVTGGASGIGRATAFELASTGAAVLVCDVDAEGAESVVTQIDKSGGKADVFCMDISDYSQVTKAVEHCVSIFGGLHMAANCAGITAGGALVADVSEAQIDRSIDINVKGTWNCLRAELPAILESGGGAIVNVSSTMGLVATPMASPYIVAKHALIGLTKAAAMEYSAMGIRVNAVCPGGTDTAMLDDQTKKALVPLHPIGRIGQPGEIASAIVFLLSPAASFVTGVAMPVDGGWTTH